MVPVSKIDMVKALKLSLVEINMVLEMEVVIAVLVQKMEAVLVVVMETAADQERVMVQVLLVIAAEESNKRTNQQSDAPSEHRSF
jgi:hypothetical protein